MPFHLTRPVPRQRTQPPFRRRGPRLEQRLRGARRATSPVVQLPLEDLALFAARQRVDEGDLARDLVAGEVLLDVGLQRVLADGAASDHESFEPLAETLVLDPDDRSLAHLLVVSED